jgi:peptidoglycan/xylan/chitin deacetylase (PgdA/CDA1 family)
LSVVRTGVKHALEAALRATGVPTIARSRRSRDVLVLAYHNVVPRSSDSAGDRSLHLSQASFAAQLDALMRTHEVVSLTDVLTQTAPRQSRPRAAITFDDAYSGALTAGVQELRTRQLPATVFITPSFLDGRSFWWDTLADPRRGLDAHVRERALSEGRGLNTEVLALAARMGLPTYEMPPHARGASTEQLNAALQYDRITFAAHTWSHPNLVSLPNAELAEELQRTRTWLRCFGERALPMVSYPYGLADKRVQNAAHEAGYTAGFMIDGGWTVAAPSDTFAIPRLNVPAGVSTNGFILRASGFIQG